jgi:hypothetical protein
MADKDSPAFKALWRDGLAGPVAVPSMSEGGQILDLALDEIEDSPFQVKQYDDARVKDLAEAIRRQGLLQPATVRRVGGKYQLISGHARRAALRLLRDKVAMSAEEKARYGTIRCALLLGVDGARAAALTAIESLQLDDGKPLEQALMVARARDAGNYQNIPETASALGLPLGRVRQYLQLAEAPGVLQRAVAPGVMVVGDDAGRERVALPITSVLAVGPYYDFLFQNRLAELKGESAVQRRREERRGRVDDSVEARQREMERRRRLPQSCLAPAVRSAGVGCGHEAFALKAGSPRHDSTISPESSIAGSRDLGYAIRRKRGKRRDSQEPLPVPSRFLGIS